MPNSLPARMRQAARPGDMPCRQALALMFVLGLAGCAVWPARALAEDRRETTVGMVARIDQIVLPGPELEVRPLDDRARPIVLRILKTYPHGSACRYDLTYYVLEPGTFDLKDCLRRKDGSSTRDLPALLVTIRPVLPPGQIQPHPPVLQSAPFLGGYHALLVVAGVAWVAGLVAIAFAGRGRRRSARAQERKALTMADRLSPLVERGLAGKLTPPERADLERSLLAYWRRRLQLQDHKPVDAFAQLRRHAEAGPLLEQLEAWLHRPGPSRRVDMAALLDPYRALPPDALPLPSITAAARTS